MVKHAKFFLLFSLLCFCNKITAGNNSSAPYVQYVHEIITSFAKEAEKEFNVYCIGGGGQMPNDIEVIEIMLVYHREVNVEQARELEIALTQKFVEKINAHEKIQPYLRERPFTRQRTTISIGFRNEDGTPFPEGSVAFVTHAKDYIYYDTNDPITNQYVDLYEEPYEEAVRILNKESQSFF